MFESTAHRLEPARPSASQTKIAARQLRATDDGRAKTSALWVAALYGFAHPHAPGLSHGCRSASEPPTLSLYQFSPPRVSLRSLDPPSSLRSHAYGFTFRHLALTCGGAVQPIKTRMKIDLHARKESKSLWKLPTANAEVRPIKTQVPIAVKWPGNTHKKDRSRPVEPSQ
jgi:hypothetical protein